MNVQYKMRRKPRVGHVVRDASFDEIASGSADTAGVVAASASSSRDAQRLFCIDLFAGCGGLSLGLELAGFTPLLFSEISPHAAETYIANRVGMELIPVGDIYNLTDTDLNLLKTYWRYKGIEDIDLVCGGPPCQGYSGIGHRRTFKMAKKVSRSTRRMNHG